LIVLGKGTARTDAVVIVYLQKAKDAKRVYATAVSARSNTEGFRLEGPIYPTNTQQIELFREALDIAKISPADVDYIESSACGDLVPLIVLIRIQYIKYSLHLVFRNKNFIPAPFKKLLSVELYNRIRF